MAAAAWIVPTVVGAGASLYGAEKSSSTAGKAAGQAMSAEERAAKLMADTTIRGQNVQYQMFQEGREDIAPWITAGKEALTGLKPVLAAGPGQFKPEEEPGYKFGYQEFVEKPTLRLAAATGKLGSGATLKALSRYASDYATTKYDNFLDRWYKSLDPAFRMAGMGSNMALGGSQQATATGANMAQTGMAGAAAQGSYLSAAGQSRAAGTLGSAYPYTQFANTLGTNLMNYGLWNAMGSGNSAAAGAAAQNAGGTYWIG